MKRATFENVRVGDMLRTFHFTGARRKKHYLYHVVRWNDEESVREAVPVGELAVGPDGGRYWIIPSVMERIGAEIFDSMFDHLSEEDYQAKLAKIQAGKSAREQAAKGEP